MIDPFVAGHHCYRVREDRCHFAVLLLKLAVHVDYAGAWRVRPTGRALKGGTRRLGGCQSLALALPRTRALPGMGLGPEFLRAALRYTYSARRAVIGATGKAHAPGDILRVSPP